MRSLHSFINNSQNTNIAIRVWSGEYFVQETKTPAPFNKPFRLINLPFYLVGSIDNIVEEEIKKIEGVPNFDSPSFCSFASLKIYCIKTFTDLLPILTIAISPFFRFVLRAVVPLSVFVDATITPEAE